MNFMDKFSRIGIFSSNDLQLLFRYKFGMPKAVFSAVPALLQRTLYLLISDN
jgi:hypothetical protein